MSSSSSTILLTRLLSLKENSPFYLVIDSIAQSSYYFIQSIISRSSPNTKIIYLSYETTNKPQYATEFLDCIDLSTSKIIEFVKSKVINPSSVPSSSPASKTLIIIDSLNYIPNVELSTLISGLIISPQIVLLGCYHSNIPEPHSSIVNYPSSLSTLSFISSSIFELDPVYYHEKLDEESLEVATLNLQFPINCKLNNDIFKITLKNRRKSGRSLTYKYILNAKNQSIEEFKVEETTSTNNEDEELLKDLTTFNLTTNSKQKLAREQVDLPYIQAQEELGSAGGAIVYEFEKDDDYDEEDPYEDPF